MTPPPNQSEAGPPAAALIDLGRVGADNDQLAQMFTVGGLSTSNFIALRLDRLRHDADGRATITGTGRVLGFDRSLPELLAVVTEYSVQRPQPFVTITTTVTNLRPDGDRPGLRPRRLPRRVPLDAPVPPALLAAPGRGFDHPVLEPREPRPLARAPALLGRDRLERTGRRDDRSRAPARSAARSSYGLLGVRIEDDPDAGGATAPTLTSVDSLFGISSHQLTAFGNPPASAPRRRRFASLRAPHLRRRRERRRDPSRTPMITELAPRVGFDTGTLSGNVDAGRRRRPSLRASSRRTTVAGSRLPEQRADHPLPHRRRRQPSRASRFRPAPTSSRSARPSATPSS